MTDTISKPTAFSSALSPLQYVRKDPRTDGYDFWPILGLCMAIPGFKGQFVYPGPEAPMERSVIIAAKRLCDAGYFPNVIHGNRLQINFPNGSELRFFSIDALDVLRGHEADAVWIDEPRGIPKEVYDAAMASLANSRITRIYL